jgi:hypothetical protein
MSLAAGIKLGPYEIVELIGAGGMGEVYRVRDTRLGREAALKVVGEQFTGRFQREAELISALNHPNICTLFDVGPNYLVMELVEGETLASTLRRGPLGFDLAALYGQQIASALAAAHARGIVHRDLKPGNIMVTGTGIKILDFGLAKRTSPSEAPAAATLTASNVIVGTPAYMSPEQLEAKETDHRTDIFALGIVLYEMAAGTGPFGGESHAALIAAILRADAPPIPGVPSRFAHIVGRCLAKKPDDRWQSASDIGAELRWAASADFEAAAAPQPPKRRSWLPAAGVAAGLLAGIAGTLLALRPQAPARVYRFAIAPPPEAEFLNVPNRSGLVLSPDGDKIAFLAVRHGQSRLWVQRLDSQTPVELPGTENSAAPFWSPDSRSLGFFAANRLQRIDADGGNRQVLAETRAPRGGTWGPDGSIVFAPDNVTGGGLYRISASGGTAIPLTTVAIGKERYHTHPQFLWDGQRFLFGTMPGYAVASLGDPRARANFELASQLASAARVDGRDYLLWVRGETIVAQSWDSGSIRTTGEPVPLGGPSSVSPQSFAVSNSGMLVYGGLNSLRLQMVDRAGQVLNSVGEPGRAVGSPAISPDGRLAAIRNGNVALIDVKRGFTTLAARGADSPVYWSPDGTRLAATREGRLIIFVPGSSETALPIDGSRVAGWTASDRYSSHHWTHRPTCVRFSERPAMNRTRRSPATDNGSHTPPTRAAALKSTCAGFKAAPALRYRAKAARGPGGGRTAASCSTNPSTVRSSPSASIPAAAKASFRRRRCCSPCPRIMSAATPLT